MNLPEWWEWDLAYTEHAEGRMEERGVSDVDLRRMLQSPSALRPARRQGRWIVEAVHGNHPWMVVLEPDFEDRLVFVVTVYPKAES